MEGTRQAPSADDAPRHFREEPESRTGDDEEEVEVGVRTEAPLEVNMTDEPGGDPYNHTGNFKKLYR